MQKQKIKKWLKIMVMSTAMVMLFVAMTLVAHAAGVEVDAADKAQFDALTGLQNMLQMALWPLLKLSGGLMDNSLLFDYGMEQRMLAIWVPIRNIVNIFFVIGLVGIALYNVLGIGGNDGSYTIKAALPKIVVGIIAINFSFLGIKVVLDMVNVLTVSVFALPSELGLGKVLDKMKEEPDNPKLQELCNQMSGVPDAQKLSTAELSNAVKMTYRPGIAENACGLDGACKNDIKTVTEKDAVKYDEAVKEKFGNEARQKKYASDVKARDESAWCNGREPVISNMEKHLANFNGNNAAIAMAVNMGNVLSFNQLDPNTKSIESIGINALFSLIMYIIYAGAFVSLVAILLGRLVVLWITIVLSPILLITLALPALKDKLESLGKLSDMFVKNAIAPLLMGIFMSVGWIMMNAIQGNASLSNTAFVGPGIPVKNLNTLQELLVSVGTIAIVWMGVFSAASGTVAEGVTKAISGALKGAGAWVGKLPLKHIPIAGMKTRDGKDVDLWTGMMALPQAMKKFEAKQSAEEDKVANALLEARGIHTGASATLSEDNQKVIDKTFSQEVLKNLGDKKTDELKELRTQLEKAFNGQNKDLLAALKEAGLEGKAKEYIDPKNKGKMADLGKELGEAVAKATAAKAATTTAATTAPAAAAAATTTAPDKAGAIKKVNEDEASIVQADDKGTFKLKPDEKVEDKEKELKHIISTAGWKKIDDLGEESLTSLTKVFNINEEDLKKLIDESQSS